MPRRPSSVTLAARLRAESARRPTLARSVVVVVALVVGARVWSSQLAAEAAQRSWGTTRTVWVTAQRIDRGGVVIAEAVQYPTALVPPGSLDAVPTSARAARTLPAGWALVEGDLLGERSVGDDWVVVAVPADGAPPLVEGDAVTLLAPGRALCDGTVTDRSNDEAVAIAVPPRCAVEAVAALGERSVVLGRKARHDDRADG